MIGIYGIFDPMTKDEYVGSSLDITRRRKQHLASLKKGTHHSPKLQMRFDKHIRFKFRIIEEIKNIAFLVKREQYHMDRVAGVLLNSSKRAGSPSQDPKVAKKISEAKIGYKHTAIARANMSTAVSKAWKTRPPVTDETRYKISKALRGIKHSDATKAKMSAAWKKRLPISEETRKKLSDSHKGVRLSKTHRANIAKALRGRKRSEEECRKISAGQRGRFFSEATRKKMRLAAKIRWAKPESHLQMRKAHKKRKSRS